MKQVKFMECTDAQVEFWAGTSDPRAHLKIGQIYVVAKEEVHKWHTTYTLEGFENLKFNSVCFEKCIGSPGVPIKTIGTFIPWKTSNDD